MKKLDYQSTSDLAKVVNYLNSEDSKKIISSCIKKIIVSNLIKTKDKPFYKQIEIMKPILVFYSLEENKFYFNKVKDNRKNSLLFDDLLKLSEIDLPNQILNSERKNEISENLSGNKFNFEKLSLVVSDFVEEEIMPVLVSGFYVMLLNFKTVEDFARSEFLDDFLNGYFPARFCNNLFGSLGAFIFNYDSNDITKEEIKKVFRKISKNPEESLSKPVLEEFILFKDEIKERIKLTDWFSSNIDMAQSALLIEPFDCLLVMNEWMQDVNKPLEVYDRFYSFIYGCYRVLLELENQFNDFDNQLKDSTLKELAILRTGISKTHNNVIDPKRDFVFERGLEILFEKIDKIESMA